MAVSFVKPNILAEPRLGGAANRGGSGGVYLLNPPDHPKMDPYDVVIRATDLRSTGLPKDAEQAVNIIDKAIAQIEHMRELSRSSRFHAGPDAEGMCAVHDENLKMLRDVRRDMAENRQSQSK